MTSYEEFVQFVIDNEKKEEWRTGQWLFNELYFYRPDLANQIRSTPADPFHSDGNVPAFWKKLYEIWTP